MKVFVSQSRNDASKLTAVVQAFPDVWTGRILDVGCRSMDLKRALPSTYKQYCGLDLSVPANIVGNIETGFPFKDKSFDTVVALDVLEHADNIHGAFAELCRVSRKYVVITLPNAYELSSRIKFLFGKRISGKYGLPLDPPDDRHRWLFSFPEAMVFNRTMAIRNGFNISSEGCLVGPRRGGTLGRLFTRSFPNFLSPWYISLLVKK